MSTDNTHRVTMLEANEERAYSYSIGGVFINFGMIEVMSYRWVEWLSTDPVMMRDLAIDMRLSDRIDLLKELIERTDWPLDAKVKAKALWTECGTLSQIRNRIAHNPFVRGRSKEGESVSGIANAKKMKGPGPYQYELLGADEITRAAFRAGEIGRELAIFLGNLKGTEIN